MREGEIAIVPKKYANIKTDAHLITYDDEDDLAKHFGIDTKKVKFKGAFLTDALLAMAVEKILFDQVDYEKINSFELDPHRQEEFNDSKGRIWVNDTKATNIDATIAALERYKDKHIHLILGGDDKGVDLSELFEALVNYKVKIYNIGSNKDRLSTLAQRYGVDFLKCENLKDAVSKIDLVLDKDQIALLSPAAASLDEYSSYAQRGDEFKNSVGKL